VRRFILIAWFSTAAAFGSATLGQEDAPGGGGRRAAAEPPAEPDIVVLGRSVRELRLQIELAEQTVLARFNDINSDDRFDIHCYAEPRYHSHIEETVCLSNSWREENADAASSALQRVRGETGPPPEEFLAEQAYMEQRLGDEMRRLVTEDPELQAAVIELAEAQSALAEHEGKPLPFSLSKELEAGSTGLPYGAKRVLEVKAGRAPWRHALTAHTFTIAQVNGDVRGLEVECLGTKVRLRYELGVEWTLPAHWGDCILAVRAKPDTTFALYEF
jgi:hypothetical protein